VHIAREGCSAQLWLEEFSQRWPAEIEKTALRWHKGREHSNKPLAGTEKFVSRQVLAGRTSKGIAWMLHRSPRTVEVHRTHVIQRLGVSGTVDPT
jgi:DNA-binding CsgD family transcriptional regulator